MLLEIGMAFGMMICAANAQQGADMDDDDFRAYVEAHGEQAGPFVRGAVLGGIASANQGPLGCAAGAALGGVAGVVDNVVFNDD